MDNRTAFECLLRKYLTKYIQYITKQDAVDQDVVEHYTKTICEASFQDPDFELLIEEDGPVETWEGDALPEFIEEHSDFFCKYVDE